MLYLVNNIKIFSLNKRKCMNMATMVVVLWWIHKYIEIFILNEMIIIIILPSFIIAMIWKLLDMDILLSYIHNIHYFPFPWWIIFYSQCSTLGNTVSFVTSSAIYRKQTNMDSSSHAPSRMVSNKVPEYFFYHSYTGTIFLSEQNKTVIGIYFRQKK